MRTKNAITILICTALMFGGCTQEAKTGTTEPAKAVMDEPVSTTTQASVAATTVNDMETESESESTTSIESEAALTQEDETDICVATEESEVRVAVEAAVKRALEANIRMQEVYKQSDTIYYDDTVAEEIYDALDLETYYFFATGKRGDWDTVVEHFENTGALQSSAITQSATDDGTTDPTDIKWIIKDSAPITGYGYEDMYNFLYGKDTELKFLTDAIPSFESVVCKELGIEDVWCCTVDIYTKATEEGVSLFRDTDPAVIDKYYEMYGIYLSDDNYVVSEMPLFVFYRDGVWRVNMGYSSLYRTAVLYKKGVVDKIGNLSGR